MIRRVSRSAFWSLEPNTFVGHARRLVPGHARPPAPLPIDPLTAGQREWLAGLTDGERARFDELPGRARARLLEPHQAGVNPDPIIQAEARSILRRPEVAEPRDDP